MKEGPSELKMCLGLHLTPVQEYKGSWGQTKKGKLLLPIFIFGNITDRKLMICSLKVSSWKEITSKDAQKYTAGYFFLWVPTS